MTHQVQVVDRVDQDRAANTLHHRLIFKVSPENPKSQTLQARNAEPPSSVFSLCGSVNTKNPEDVFGSLLRVLLSSLHDCCSRLVHIYFYRLLHMQHLGEICG